LKQEPSWQRGDRNGRTLVEESGLRVTLIAMKAGTKIKEHRTDGRVSIHTIAGQLRIQVADETVDLASGHVLILDRAVPHDVEAVGQESAFLLTVAMPGGG
jgi:quercetin dioxygenase-like cupin family protein